MLAKLIYSEARGVPSKMEQAAIVWCVLNRVDSDGWPETIKANVTRPNQFAWVPDAPLVAEFQILAENV
jgi:spore germination cell wall hydrolase CwlJ-like protein